MWAHVYFATIQPATQMKHHARLEFGEEESEKYIARNSKYCMIGNVFPDGISQGLKATARPVQQCQFHPRVPEVCSRGLGRPRRRRLLPPASGTRCHGMQLPTERR
jgi:hypothetical protein